MKTQEDRKLQNFEEAFRGGGAGCRDTCECGREFFDGENSGWDWDEGEFEALVESKTATRLPYTVERVCFEGKVFMRDCDCWHDKAKRIMAWLDENPSQIAEYFKLEKARLEEVAKQSVTLTILYDEAKDGWREMGSAPRNATTLEVLMHNRTIKLAHWAQDLSGECQPAFRGWFEKRDGHNCQIDDPIAWRHLK